MAAIDSLRPRFLPDRDAQREWGDKGASVARMIRKAFPVPPSAAMGLGQVQQWLESFPEHGPAIESLRRGDEDAQAHLKALRMAILSAPMPEHWKRSTGTLRQFLCGDPPEFERGKSDESWPLLLRPSPGVEGGSAERISDAFESVRVSETSPEGIWRGFLEVVASGYGDAAVRRLAEEAVDPGMLRIGVLIQPLMMAELSGRCLSRDRQDSSGGEGYVAWSQDTGTADSRETRILRRSHPVADLGEVAPFWEALWKRSAKAEKIVGGPAELQWIWDGEQLWFLRVRPILAEGGFLAPESPRGLTRGLFRRWFRARA